MYITNSEKLTNIRNLVLIGFYANNHIWHEQLETEDLEHVYAVIEETIKQRLLGNEYPSSAMELPIGILYQINQIPVN
jgi:ABC-type molybdenum transport system ATPase subunit/photorepair protein PhrA